MVSPDCICGICGHCTQLAFARYRSLRPPWGGAKFVIQVEKQVDVIRALGVYTYQGRPTISTRQIYFSFHLRGRPAARSSISCSTCIFLTPR